jgi:hypothetical protein
MLALERQDGLRDVSPPLLIEKNSVFCSQTLPMGSAYYCVASMHSLQSSCRLSEMVCMYADPISYAITENNCHEPEYVWVISHISVYSETVMVLDKIMNALELVVGSIILCRQVDLPTIVPLSSTAVIYMKRFLMSSFFLLILHVMIGLQV